MKWKFNLKYVGNSASPVLMIRSPFGGAANYLSKLEHTLSNNQYSASLLIRV